MKSKKERLVIETESDTQQIIALKKENAHLKMIIGEKQIQIDFKDKMIEIAEDHYGVDIKKKFETTPSDIIKNIKKNTHTP